MMLLLAGFFFCIMMGIPYFIAFLLDRRARKAGFHYNFDHQSPNAKKAYEQTEAENMKYMTEMNMSLFLH